MCHLWAEHLHSYCVLATAGLSDIKNAAHYFRYTGYFDRYDLLYDNFEQLLPKIRAVNNNARIGVNSTATLCLSSVERLLCTNNLVSAYEEKFAEDDAEDYQGDCFPDKTRPERCSAPLSDQMPAFLLALPAAAPAGMTCANLVRTNFSALKPEDVFAHHEAAAASATLTAIVGANGAGGNTVGPLCKLNLDDP